MDVVQEIVMLHCRQMYITNVWNAAKHYEHFDFPSEKEKHQVMQFEKIVFTENVRKHRKQVENTENNN